MPMKSPLPMKTPVQGHVRKLDRDLAQMKKQTPLIIKQNQHGSKALQIFNNKILEPGKELPPKRSYQTSPHNMDLLLDGPAAVHSKNRYKSTH